MPRSSQLPDPDDFFADTRMSFGDHIEELRTHLLRAIYGFMIGMLISLPFAKFVFYIITSPVQSQLMEFYNHRVEKVARELKNSDPALELLNKPTEMVTQVRVQEFQDLLRRMGIPLAEQVKGEVADEWIQLPLYIRPVDWEIKVAAAQRQVGRPPMLATFSVMEAFVVYIKIFALTGLVISSPWVFWQLWAFVAAGLYPHEKRYVHHYLPMSLGLFLTGVFTCQFMVIPKAIGALLWFNEWLDLEPDLRLNEWLSFAILLPLVFGICFQTPLVMLFLSKIGLMDTESFRKKRRIAWFAMAAIAAVITPVDALSMILLWVPMCGLYELGILMVRYGTTPPEMEPALSEEMIEV